MNILVTGASRGIGAAAYELLKSRGHNVVGHSTTGNTALIGAGNTIVGQLNTVVAGPFTLATSV